MSGGAPLCFRCAFLSDCYVSFQGTTALTSPQILHLQTAPDLSGSLVFPTARHLLLTLLLLVHKTSPSAFICFKRAGDPICHCVRNMGNFNFSLTHVLTVFHHVEQCCYPSFLIIPISQPWHLTLLMSFTLYLRSSRHKDFVTLHFLLISLSLICILGPYFSYDLYLFPFFSYPCRLTHSV